VLQDGAEGLETSDADPAPEPADEAADEPADESSVKPANNGKSLPQPDLRNLIPDLTNAAAQDP
jgi:hypothetical protein